MVHLNPKSRTIRMCPGKVGRPTSINALGEGRERGILREASSGEAATSTDGLEGGTKGLK